MSFQEEIRLNITNGREFKKSIKKIVDKFKIELTKAVEVGTAKQLQHKIQEQLKKYSVTGRLLSSLRLHNPRLQRKFKIISIGNGLPALLLESSDVAKLHNYPKFVTFKQEPELEEWVKTAEAQGILNENVANNFIESGGLTVGGKNTSFGKKRWFSNAVRLSKHNLKSVLLKELSKIKIKI